MRVQIAGLNERIAVLRRLLENYYNERALCWGKVIYDRALAGFQRQSNWRRKSLLAYNNRG